MDDAAIAERSKIDAPNKPANRALALLMGAFFLAVAACGGRSTLTPGSRLEEISAPPPRVRVITVTPVPQTATSSPAVVSQATSLPASLAELARSVHGERLIEWIAIPDIHVLAPVEPVGWQPVSDGNYGSEIEWDSPDAGVGWAVSSALPGDEANIILYGHNNLNASVFLRLGELAAGDEIRLTTGQEEWVYRVATVDIYPAENDPQLEAIYQASFLPGSSARLTLWSCWPPTGNSHRVIVVACPEDGCSS